MAATKSTVERVLVVILKHVPKETALQILEELMTVPRQQVVPRYHRADVQPCASTVIATIPSEATRGAHLGRGLTDQKAILSSGVFLGLATLAQLPVGIPALGSGRVAVPDPENRVQSHLWVKGQGNGGVLAGGCRCLVVCS